MNNFLARMRQSQPTDLKINTPNDKVRGLIDKRDIVKMGSGVERIDAEDYKVLDEDNIFEENNLMPDHIFKFPLPKPIYTKNDSL